MVGLTVWFVLVAVTVVVCLAVIVAVRKPIRQLLEVNSYISPAKSFYLRVFTVLMFLAALATVSQTKVPAGDKALMEYLWWVVDAVQPFFLVLSFWLIGYAAMLTVLFVVLGRYRD
jgi:hypothetical protein